MPIQRSLTRVDIKKVLEYPSNALLGDYLWHSWCMLLSACRVGLLLARAGVTAYHTLPTASLLDIHDDRSGNCQISSC